MASRAKAKKPIIGLSLMQTGAAVHRGGRSREARADASDAPMSADGEFRVPRRALFTHGFENTISVEYDGAVQFL